MRLEEAIERLSFIDQSLPVTLGDEEHKALQLGIEAGKYIIYRDNCPGINTRLLLPGETEE